MINSYVRVTYISNQFKNEVANICLLAMEDKDFDINDEVKIPYNELLYRSKILFKEFDALNTKYSKFKRKMLNSLVK